MAEDISGFGAQVRLIASTTFPTGFDITQFADDTDPFDIPSLQIADKAMGLNGDLVSWSTANPIEITLSVIPESDDDINLKILAEVNRVGRGKPSVQDEITIVVIYPNGRILSLLRGKLTDMMPGSSIASSGRLKSKEYVFAFENKTEV